MPLSTSSSEAAIRSDLSIRSNRKLRLATVAVIASFVTVFLFAEILSRFAFPRISQIEGRIRGDEREAWSIVKPAPGSRPTVLIVGNSLLLRGLDYPKIRAELAPQARVVRFGIENTLYVDWYFGLRHLFESGVRPSMIVLCLNLGQTVSSGTLGDYSARHLFGTSELLPVARETGMDATRTSGLFFAHWSAFYASRATIRNFILNKTDPPYARALHTIVDNIAIPLPADDELIRTARTRLNAIQQLCRQNGVELVLLIPPSLGRYNELLASAADLEHVNYDYPLPMGTLGAEFFSDRAHLNEQGAAIFTDALTRRLRTRLGNTSEMRLK